MDEKIILKGRSLIKGLVEGEALVTKQPFAFSHGIDLQTGIITDKKHELFGKSIRDKVFIYPHGKGSTTAAQWLLGAIQSGVAPKAIINVKIEPIIAIGLIIAEMFFDKKIVSIDMLDKDPTKVVFSGDYVRVDGYKGILEILKRRR